MGPLVGRGEVYQAFQLQNQQVTRNALVNTFFNIYEENLGGNRLTSARDSIMNYKRPTGAASAFADLDKKGVAQPRYQSMVIPQGTLDPLSLIKE